MGICHSKVTANPKAKCEDNADSHTRNSPSNFPFFTPSPLSSVFKNSPSGGAKRRSRPFPPPSPAKHIKELLARRHGSAKPNQAPIPEEGNGDSEVVEVNREFGYSKQFVAHYEIGEEVGRGHFGFTCRAKAKKGSLKGRHVAVKIIPKSKMTTAIAVDDVKREVKILQALNGHKNIVQFHGAFEDDDNVYILMELCEGGELLDRMLSRGGIYAEEDAKDVIVQILSAVAFCHLQGVVHRDLKPENFLFTTKEEDSPLKVIDFGLSDFVNPDEKLNDIVGSAYYVAPEVLHRSYGTEADMWSIGVIAYILLCGSRPFWARTESGIFRTVLKEDPSFDDDPWPSLSSDAKDFVQGLLHKNQHKRLTAAQALCHPWLTNHPHVKIPLDIIVYKLVRAYIYSSSLRKLAFNALAKTLSFVQLAYLREQFDLLGPNKDGFISLRNFKTALMKASTDAMNDSGVIEYVDMVSSTQYKRLDFEEFCAAAISVHQLKGAESWELHARYAYDLFDEYGNRPIMIEELASELGLAPSIPLHVVLQDWIRPSDGKLSFLGFIKLLNEVPSCTNKKT
ncbi:CDPK-related kinase 1-like [Cucurbita pepo subsp. pepo]|uniref:CDPK-related kinase 1-like n=1 Tax=Cucurbita pepo subsp. pepo TaxID=3664 RepID=UPI000C9D61B5|nr:CDPK-related kinase 1-like [Cucurbita pepo subsp. pepo]